MERIDLKELKEALNKIPDEELEKCFITHPYSTENIDEDNLFMICMDEEYAEFFEKYDTKLIGDFAKQVFEDAKKVFIVMLDEDKAEDYQDDF